MPTILLIEDNQAIAEGLIFTLKPYYQVIHVTNLKNAFASMNEKIDCILLDLMLPDGSGYQFCQKIKQNNDVPILILSAKDMEDDIVKGFDLGCDDYLTKPFRTKELLSRIKRLLKKQPSIYTYGQVKMDIQKQKVFVKEEEIILTPLEYRILQMLFMNQGTIVTRNQILEKIWDMAGNFVNDNTLTVYIKRIRCKLKDEDIIKTIKGIGYKVDL